MGQTAAPHQLAPRLVVVRLLQCLGGVDHHRPQDGFCDAVGDLIGTGVDAEIALHGVQHHIRRPAGGLVGGEGVGQGGIQDGKGGTVEGGVAAPLAVGGFVGQDRRVAGLAARRGDGEHAAHGQSCGDGTHLGKIVPDGTAAGQADGHRLAGVQHAGAAHAQKKVNALAGIGVRQLLGFGQTGVGLDAALDEVGQPLLVQRGQYLAQDAVPLDAACAVEHQHPAAACRFDRLACLGDGVRAKQDPCGQMKLKCVHGGTTFRAKSSISE